MDRFSILRRYSCSTPSKLYHQRTIRFTLVRSTPHRLFSCSFKTCFLIYDIELSSSFFYCLLQYFFSRTIYVFLLYPSFSIQMSLDTFLFALLKLFVAFFIIPLNGMAVTSWPVLVVAPRLAPSTLGKLYDIKVIFDVLHMRL